MAPEQIWRHFLFPMLVWKDFPKNKVLSGYGEELKAEQSDPESDSKNLGV
jgi:hypothetical protein